MYEALSKLKKRINVKYGKIFLLVAVTVYLLLFIIAFFMKDHANHTGVKSICHEYVYGPKNMIALVINKFIPGAIDVNSAFEQDIQETQESVQELSEDEKAVKAVLDRYEKQKALDDRLRSEYEAGGYTLDEPLIVVNPYGIAPLTALLMFDTDSPAQVELRVVGHKPEEDVLMPPHSGQNYTVQHIVPVYGLYAGEENRVEVKCTSQSGEQQTKVITIVTEPLPDLMTKINLQITYDDIAQIGVPHGLNFSYSSLDSLGIKYAFDVNGNIRWFFSDACQLGGTNYNNGKNIYRAIGSYAHGDCILAKESYLGRIETMYYLSEGIHHDVQLSDHNSLLITTSDTETIEDKLVEINLFDGKEVNSVEYSKILPRGRDVGFYRGLNGGRLDWAHINAVLEYDGDYISSSNIQSAVLRHSKDGRIKWILSDPYDYTTFWKKHLLTPIGKDFEYPYNQHAVEVLPDYDNNPDTIDILLFDNGSSRNVMNRELQKAVKLRQMTEPRLYSRLVHYRINEKNMTVEQIWQYGKDRPELFAEFRGDADLLPNGNILGTFVQERYETSYGEKRPYYYHDTVYVEVDRDGHVIWECYGSSKTASNHYTDYRLCRTNIYNSSVDYSHLLDESHNYVPDEIMKKYGY